MERVSHRFARWLAVFVVLSGCRKAAPEGDEVRRGGVEATPVHSAAPELARPEVGDPARRDDSPAGSKLRYHTLTMGSSDPDAELPWIVAFHGLGDTPRGFAHLFEGLPLRAHVYLVQAPLPYGSGYDWFGERVTGDPERLALAVQRRVDDVAALLKDLSSLPQNRDAAVVTGFSQGGILSFAVAVAGIGHVRAALPIAGWLPPSLAASPPVVPVYAFHGEQDDVVPFGAATRMVQSWQSKPGAVEYRTFPGVGHRVSAAMRSEWSARLSELMR